MVSMKKRKPHIVRRLGYWKVWRKGGNFTWRCDAMIWCADQNEKGYSE